MSHLYLYERKQRRSAITLFINMVVVFGMYLAAHKFIEPTEAGQQLLFWINIAVPVVLVCLFIIAAVFWYQNGRFTIGVDANNFEMIYPLAKSGSFSVPVSDIVEIRQTHQKHVSLNKLSMYMKSGEKIQITQNYNYSRKKLYAALAKVNPAIILPKNSWRFKQV